MFASSGSCNKLPLAGSRKTTESHPLRVLDAGSLQRRWWQGLAPSAGLGKRPSLPLSASGACRFWWQPLEFLGQGWLPHPRFCLSPGAFLSVCLQASFLKGRRPLGLGPTLLSHDFILDNYICREPISK